MGDIMKYILNEIPVKTTNSFNINNLKIDLDIPKDFTTKEFITKNTQDIEIKYSKSRDFNSNIGLTIPSALNIDINITKSIKKTIEFIYEFTNAVLERDIQKVSSMYANFKKENISPDYIITSLANVFRQSLIIKMLYNEGKSNYDIAHEIGKKEFYVKKMLERLFIYTEDDLSNLIIKLAKIDIDYKYI